MLVKKRVSEVRQLFWQEKKTNYNDDTYRIKRITLFYEASV